VEARKLKGFRDYLPALAAARDHIKQTVLHHAHIAGFEPIETPAIEYQDVLLGSGGGDTDKEVYRFMDHGEREVALRFDLTVPFARYVTENFNELSFPFKRVQIGEVWRGEKPQKGRYRQFCQADLDIVGSDSMAADIEVIRCLASVIDELVPAHCTMQLNHRIILSNLIQKFLGEVDSNQEQEILIAIDKLGKIGREKVVDLISQIGPDVNRIEQLLDCIWDPEEALSNLVTVLGENEHVKRFQATLDILNEITADLQVSIIPNLAIARGLGYYTGVVFETTIDELPNFGSISSGGRYDNLVARFGKHDLSGVGGSIGVDRLLAGLEELNKLPTIEPARAFVAIATEDAVGYGFRIAEQLRREGIATDISVKETKLVNQFKLANKRGYPYVITVGKDEVAAGSCTLKDMTTGKEERNVKIADLSLKLGVRL
jgi:histidyl-tRNA synthetase